MKLSFEERHGVMSGTVKFPDDFMTESLREYYIGSDGAYCNSCKAEPSQGANNRLGAVAQGLTWHASATACAWLST